MQNRIFEYNEYREIVPWTIKSYPSTWELFNSFPIGIELEVERGGCDFDKMKQICLAGGYDVTQPGVWDFIIAKDSSVRTGAEVIAQPANLGGHEHHYDWEALLNKATELGYTGEDGHGAGLHYNVDRASLFSPYNTDVNALILSINNMDWLKKLSRRIYRRPDGRMVDEDDAFYYCQWPTQFVDKITPDDIINRWAQTMSKMRDVITWCRDNGSAHYRATSLKKDKCIEFRFCASTLHYPYFMANLQLIAMMCWAIKNMDPITISTLRLDWFWQTAKTHKMEQFINLCTQTRIDVKPTIFPMG